MRCREGGTARGREAPVLRAFDDLESSAGQELDKRRAPRGCAVLKGDRVPRDHVLYDLRQQHVARVPLQRVVPDRKTQVIDGSEDRLPGGSVGDGRP